MGFLILKDVIKIIIDLEWGVLYFRFSCVVNCVLLDKE